MQQVPGGLFDANLQAAYKEGHKGVPQSISPRRWSPAWISWMAKVDPPKTWDEFIEVARSCRSRSNSWAMACAWGCTPIPKAT